MAFLIESSIWVDFTRAKSSRALKERILPWILDPAASIGEPVAFEVLRHATPVERPRIEAQFATFPLLETPPMIWRDATRLGQRCRDAGVTAGSLDLLISALALHHAAELVTFDLDYLEIAKATGLRVRLLKRD